MDGDKENGISYHTPKAKQQQQQFIAQRLFYGPLTERRNTHVRSATLPDVVSKSELVRQDMLTGTPVTSHRNTTISNSNHKNLSPSVELTNTTEEPRTPCYNDTNDKISPGLALLRNTPGVLKEKQKRLITQHEEIRQKGDQLRTGGGISLWPDMVQMRLTRSEMIKLGFQAFCLCVLALSLLYRLHGDVLYRLRDVTIKVNRFCHKHQISDTFDQSVFQEQVINWHTGFLHIVSGIVDEFTVNEMSASCQLYFLTYMCGLGTLLYYLLDNMLAHNKLTPSRIKKWTCLLAMIGTWTIVMGYGLFLAYQLERTLSNCVQSYSDALAYLVVSPLQLNTYHGVLLYWRSKLLDDATPGIVSVLGVVPVRHLVQYLQFYSVPIVTVIVSPVIKLCSACVVVYSNGEYISTSVLS